MSSSPLFIGLDAGGSKTELLARIGSDAAPFTLLGPTANLQRLGAEAAAQVLSDLVHEALAAHPQATLAALCAGVAGAGRPEDQAALSEALCRRLGDAAPATLYVTHDAEIALAGAFDGASGVLVIAGTGSVALARTTAGTLHRAGGWGFLLGDEGGGYRVGLEGLRAMATALDGGPPTVLTQRLADHFGLDDGNTLIRRVYREQWPLQHAAPLVVQAAVDGDAVAQHIIAEQTAHLATQVGRLIGRHPDVTPRLALVGGLTQEPPYRAALTEALHGVLPGWSVETPHHSPAAGACLLAEQQLHAPA